MIVLLSIILSDVVPMRERGLWQGWLNVLSMVGMSVGAPLGIHPLRPLTLCLPFFRLFIFA